MNETSKTAEELVGGGSGEPVTLNNETIGPIMEKARGMGKYTSVTTKKPETTQEVSTDAKKVAVLQGTAIVCGRCKKPKLTAEELEGVEYCECGRPRKYTPKLLEKAWEYVDLKMPCKETDEEFHSLAGLAVYLEVSKDTIQQWNKDTDKPEFSVLYNAIMVKQEKRLTNNGTKGIYSNTITKLMLTKHGYRDSVENLTYEVPVDPEAKAKADAAIAEYLSNNKQ